MQLATIREMVRRTGTIVRELNDNEMEQEFAQRVRHLFSAVETETDIRNLGRLDTLPETMEFTTVEVVNNFDGLSSIERRVKRKLHGVPLLPRAS